MNLIDIDELSQYIKKGSILEFESDEACMEYFNTYDFQNLRTVEEMKSYQGKYGFNIGDKRYHIDQDCALDVWVPLTRIDFYVRCFDRVLTVYVRVEDEQKASEMMQMAYDVWVEELEDIGDACCEEFICDCLSENGIRYL